MGLGCLCKASLMPLESKSHPAVLLYTQVPGTKPGSPGFCLQLSFRPPSKLLFYIALPGTPTVTKLSPHYSTVYKRDPIFMPEYQLLGPLTLPKARTGSGSHTAAPRNLVVKHCIESAQTNMVVSWPVCWMQLHASIKKLKPLLSAIKQLENCLQPRIITSQFSGTGYETAQTARGLWKDFGAKSESLEIYSDTLLWCKITPDSNKRKKMLDQLTNHVKTGWKQPNL